MSLLVALLVAAATPSATISPADCAAAIAYSDAHRGVDVLVLKDGQPVCEGGDAAPHELWSGTKSFVGIIAAAAVQDKLLNLDERVDATLTEWRDDPVRRWTTIRQLLSMTDGQRSVIGQPPTYADAVAVPASAPPGMQFNYGPTPMQVFGEVMRRKLVSRGQPGDPVAYLKRRVLDPAGVTVTQWRAGADGHPLMPQGAVMTAQAWARFGEFVRVGGKVGGRSLVDPAAFRELFRGSPANPAYGLTWWLPRPTKASDPVTASSDLPANSATLPADLVYAAGAGDQRLYVIPSRGLTIVRQATLDIRAAIAGERSGWSDTEFLRTLLRGMSDQ